MRVDEKHFDDPLDFLNFLSSWNSGLSGYAFRGHSKEKYELLPSILREENRYLIHSLTWRKAKASSFVPSDYELTQIQSEYVLLRDFYRTADRHGLKVPESEYLRRFLAGRFDITFMLNHKKGDKWIPFYLQETAALAQHYGLPTRLLDWTYDPYIAAYFALKGATDLNGKIVIWCLNTITIANEVNLNNDFPLKLITPPYFSNTNLSAQKGVFTHIESELHPEILFGNNPLVDRRPLNQFINDLPPESLSTSQPLLLKITLPVHHAENAYSLLEEHGYGDARIYPGYGGVVKQVMNQKLISQSLRQTK